MGGQGRGKKGKWEEGSLASPHTQPSIIFYTHNLCLAVVGRRRWKATLEGLLLETVEDGSDEESGTDTPSSDVPSIPPLNYGDKRFWPSGARRGIQKVHFQHEMLIDRIIAAEGNITQRELSELSGFSETWISQIFNSDAFQRRLAQRREELMDPIIRAHIKEQFEWLVQRSTTILRKKLARPSRKVPANLALRAFELSTRAAGYGARVEPTQINVNVETHLEGLSGNLVALLRKKKAEAEEPIDAQTDPEP